MVWTNPWRIPHDNIERSVWVTRIGEMDGERKERQFAQVLDSAK
jgi:hypothetical protein